MVGRKNKSKLKGRQYKATKKTHNDNDVNEDLDLSQLRMPIHTSITGLGQAVKVFDTATEEVYRQADSPLDDRLLPSPITQTMALSSTRNKNQGLERDMINLKGMLSRECDIIYDCKVCRSMFRGLPNFVSHKRMFCTEKYNSFQHSDFMKYNVAFDIKKITTTEKGYQESLRMERNDVEPLTKDLTAVAEGINNDSEREMILQKIPETAVAVSVISGNYDTDEKLENMHTQVKELNNKVVLKSGGIQSSVDEMDTATDNVKIISQDDKLNMLKCKMCDLQFPTQETFRFHMKCKHVKTRLLYPCPDCVEMFSHPWSAFRHLYKVHGKTVAQVIKLKQTIMSKALKINNSPAFFGKRENIHLKVAALKKSCQEKLEQKNEEVQDGEIINVNDEDDDGHSKDMDIENSLKEPKTL